MPQASRQSDARIAISHCAVCESIELAPVRTAAGLPVRACSACGFQFASPQPSDADLAAIYDRDYFFSHEKPREADHASTLKRATARHYLALLAAVSAAPGRRLLEIGCGHGDFLVEAAAQGYVITGLEYSPHACEVTRARVGDAAEIVCGELETWHSGDREFDLVVLSDVIEHVRHPRAFLVRLHQLLARGALVFIATPDLQSRSARMLRSHWMEYKAEHLSYFSRATLCRLLESTGYEVAARHPGYKTLSLAYVAGHFRRFPVRMVTPVLCTVARLLPVWLRERPFSVVASGLIVIARRR